MSDRARQLPPFPTPAWRAAAIARRVRDDAMMRAVLRGHNPNIRLPRWLQEAQP